MPQQVGQGATITVDALFRDGGGAPVAPTTPQVDIISPTAVTLVNNAVPYFLGPELGRYAYDYVVPVGAPLGIYQVHWTATIAGVAVQGDDTFEVVAGGSIDFTSTTLWFDPDDLSECGGTAGQQLEAAAVASDVLSALSGGRWGQQQTTVRPNLCAPVCGCGFGSRLGAAWSGGLYYGCACDNTKLRLPGHVASVEQVTIDGVALSPNDYAVYDFAWLVRQDGYGWPCCQSLATPAGEEATFTVTYTQGLPISDAAAAAARELACELVKGATGGECRLPTGVTNVAREGISFAVTDLTDLMASGRTGLYAVDLWLDVVNPNKLRSGPRIINPDDVISRVETG